MGDSWRDEARPIIAEVIGMFSASDDAAYVKKAVMATYPWGERAMWPYKVWCSEARRQMAAFRLRQLRREGAQRHGSSSNQSGSPQAGDEVRQCLADIGRGGGAALHHDPRQGSLL